MVAVMPDQRVSAARVQEGAFKKEAKFERKLRFVNFLHEHVETGPHRLRARHELTKKN
jgi:hypothetical protein